MSTIRATFVQHGSSAVPNITLNASGQVIVASGIVSSGTFAAPSGSVSAPGIYFNNDNNTGLYSPAADTIAFTEGGVEALRIDSSGRVGIGTSSPANLLHLYGSAALQNIEPSSTSTASYIRYTGGGSDRAYLGLERGDGGGGIIGSGAYAFVVSTASTNPLVFGTNGTERARIDSSGRLGIGTTAPSDLLHVRGVAPNIRIDGGTSPGTYGVKVYGDATEQINFTYNNQTGENRIGGVQSYIFPTFFSGGSERARIDTSGRLLVGTSSTSADVRSIFQGTPGSLNTTVLLSSVSSTPGSGDGLGYLTFSDSSHTFSAWVAAQRDGGTWSGSSKPTRLVFSTCPDSGSSPVERMRITSGGSVLIGTSSTSDQGRKLNIEDSVSTSNHGPLRVVNTNASADRVCTIGINNSGGGTLIAFDVNGVGKGSVTTNGSTISYNTSSDYRLKENVVAVSDGITRLQQLKPSRFNFIADPAKTVDGFLAHEAAEVVPECVTGEKDAVDDGGNPIYQGIDQSKLVPLLTAALQEAVAEINALKDRVAALEGA